MRASYDSGAYIKAYCTWRFSPRGTKDHFNRQRAYGQRVATIHPAHAISPQIETYVSNRTKQLISSKSATVSVQKTRQGAIVRIDGGEYKSLRFLPIHIQVLDMLPLGYPAEVIPRAL